MWSFCILNIYKILIKASCNLSFSSSQTNTVNKLPAVMQIVSNISLLWLHAANLNLIGCKWMIYSFKIVWISLWLNWMCSLSSVIRQLSYGQVIPLCLFDLTSSGTNGSIRWREALGGRSSMNLRKHRYWTFSHPRWQTGEQTSQACSISCVDLHLAVCGSDQRFFQEM